ncbi:hypothetical protein P775_28730 [Puniceibacterium antarcticum]|uniref:Uncharacterized protein n=1 Tax=Puniceibacterium antarcticum TaxID=1206336 RepID=A0A2G8QR05_9RHOB|nr:hypothetical protein P775_28730 [Puniceibacterium antarcticum]
MIHRLAVMLRGIADVTAPNQFVHAINVDVLLVAVMRPPVLFGPPRIQVILRPFR